NGGVIGTVRMLFDRGREFELIGRYCYSVRISFDFYRDTFVSKLNSELGYHLALLLEYSNPFEFVNNGDKRVANKLFEETLHQDNVLCIIARLHVTKKYESGNADELTLQIHPNSRCSFKGNVGFLKLLLRYCLLTILGCVRRILSSARCLRCSVYVTGR
ncbi:hypothetical protein MKW98_016802, partial [Papaver atlanticum]